MSGPSLTIATWNLEWKPAGSPQTAIMLERLRSLEPDILCLTEAYADGLSGEGGHAIEAEADYGYPLVAGRRKVILWSREPWSDVHRLGDPDLPPGRFVAGRTRTPLGELTIIGVCVPWRDAHVRTGRKDRQPWQDHQQYLAGLQKVLARSEGPAIAIGDFNQTVPRTRAPATVFAALERALDPRFTIATSGPLRPGGLASIDHIAHTSELSANTAWTLSNVGPRGEVLSDHFGVAAELNRIGGD